METIEKGLQVFWFVLSCSSPTLRVCFDNDRSC